MDKAQMLAAIAALDAKVKVPLQFLLGGGGAMVLAYQFPVATQDLDAILIKSSLTEGDIHAEIQAVATELSLPKDWLNPYFGTFLFTLPKNYAERLKNVFSGRFISVEALGKEDLLVLKCYAGRDKDIPHAMALLKKGADIDFVEKHLRSLIDLRIPGSQAACDFFDDLVDSLP